MVDLDGKYEYSKTMRVAFEREFLMTIKPNPAHGQLQVDLANRAGTASLMLYTQQGKPGETGEPQCVTQSAGGPGPFGSCSGDLSFEGKIGGNREGGEADNTLT